jgi:hypothetical protein
MAYRERTTENLWEAIGLKLATVKGMKVVRNILV